MKYYYLLGAGLLIFLISGCLDTATTNNNTNNQGNIEIKGSDTLLQLVSNMAEVYSKDHPGVKISVTGGGSGTGIASLINGEIDIADASRPMKEKELKRAEERGFTPSKFIIARDMLSIVVNKDNPISKLTMEELSKIYQGKITNWSEVGGDDREINLYGRQSTSGTYVYFMENVVKGEYSPHMKNMEGNQAIVDAVKQDKTAIGYVGLGYVIGKEGKQIEGIKVVKIAKDGSSAYVSPLDKKKRSEYPISRPLFQYLPKKPVEGTIIYNFLLFELSKEGQDIVRETGFVPITPQDRQHNLAQLEKEQH